VHTADRVICRSGHFSPSWLAPLRFTSVEKRPDRLSIFARGLTGGLPAMFFEEVSSLSHVPVLRDINPSLDTDKFAGTRIWTRLRPEGPATGRRWSTMTRKIIAGARPRSSSGDDREESAHGRAAYSGESGEKTAGRGVPTGRG
jgi:hypothetical protein